MSVKYLWIKDVYIWIFLRMNIGKTVTMRNPDTNVRIKVSGTLVKEVDKFIYLFLCIVTKGKTMSLWTAASNRPIVQPPNDTWVNMEQRWNDIDGKTEELGGKPVPVLLCPSQIPHGLPWVRTLASTVRSRWLTAWAMAWPIYLGSEINSKRKIDGEINKKFHIVSILEGIIWNKS
jgi:hypothetical protein